MHTDNRKSKFYTQKISNMEPKYQYMINEKEKDMFAPDLLFDNDLQLDFAFIYVTKKTAFVPFHRHDLVSHKISKEHSMQQKII